MIDEQTFRILNAVHLKRMTDPSQLAALAEKPEAVVRQVLADAVERGTALDLGGQYMLAESGTQEVRDYYAQAYAAQRADPGVAAWYERFEGLNADFIRQVSDYQNGGERAQARLMKTVERLMKALADLLPAIPRYDAYVKRFDAVLLRIDEGELQYVASPTVDSVHNIWFEFHEDILTVLGRPRDT